MDSICNIFYLFLQRWDLSEHRQREIYIYNSSVYYTLVTESYTSILVTLYMYIFNYAQLFDITLSLM